ncbi:hypothetical protein T310_5272 [Rasamsonia emersonii CBS 393.64]|uniref:Rhodopsin domain-containing protein n=1 Tax=Rasamsonia emersonii (strain ATCC 16479 / CBS 393.64 / IMI 116815) TaxID=1408163 RepID=A0A0F4YRI1_RASE3|nr:hypothetical protein T310_5272 [Rasamsonia emersonii CBS 393.64]KKA20690.1 hypothetical protein T310_5272 [Rasamsonia emersonii CBS 393.64]
MDTVSHVILPRGDDTPISPRSVQAVVVSVVFTTMATCLVSARLYTRIHIIHRIESNDLMVIAALTFRGKIRHGQAHGGHPAKDSHQADESILAHHPLLQRSSHLRQSLDSAAVLSRLPDKENAHRLLGDALRARFVRHMGGRERVPQLHPRVQVLGARDAGILPEHEGTVVLERQHAHHDRSGDSDSAHSGAQHVGPAEKAEDCADGHFCRGVCITSIIRLVSLKVIADSSDPTYDNVGAATWSSIECNTGIICACLPTLRPLISRILPRFLSSLSGSRSQSKSQSHRRLDDENNRATPTYRNNGTQPSAAPEEYANAEDDEYRVEVVTIEPLMPGMPRITRDGTIEFPKPVHVETEEREKEKRGSSR